MNSTNTQDIVAANNDDGNEKLTDFSNMGLSDAWLYRFNFYKENGLPSSKNKKYKESFKKLSFGERFKLGFNVWAYFFGPFYYLYLGMWRKAITLTFILVITALMGSLFLPAGFAISFALLSTMLVGPSYYLHKVKNSKSFNLFETDS